MYFQVCSNSTYPQHSGEQYKTNGPLFFTRFSSKFHNNEQNLRTSGPVNAHLTPSPCIYFNAFIHVYSPRAEADNPLGDKLLMSTESPYHFDHLLQVSNKSL